MASRSKRKVVTNGGKQEGQAAPAFRMAGGGGREDFEVMVVGGRRGNIIDSLERATEGSR